MKRKAVKKEKTEKIWQKEGRKEGRKKEFYWNLRLPEWFPNFRRNLVPSSSEVKTCKRYVNPCPSRGGHCDVFRNVGNHHLRDTWSHPRRPEFSRGLYWYQNIINTVTCLLSLGSSQDCQRCFIAPQTLIKHLSALNESLTPTGVLISP